MRERTPLRAAPRLTARSLLGTALLVVAALLSTPAVAAAPHTFYVSLGDSLAVGTQPDAHGSNHETAQGYVDVLGRRLASKVAPELALVKLGCSGETTAKMLYGAGCRNRAISQLTEAEGFLTSHRGAVALVTVGIGDNDVERCFHADGTLDRACVAAGLSEIRKNLPAIATRLRTAAGPGVALVGVTDYDQFLAFWLRGAGGRSAALTSVRLVSNLNQTVDSIYRSNGIVVADAAPRFATTDIGHAVALAGHGRVPQSVARICRLTWACSPAPIGMNDHANAAGYRVIADAVQASLERVAPQLFPRRQAHPRRPPRSH
ncbi:MAG: hypothetical protein NVSMB25_12790 [Thermoleophilaceae bacterium]